MIRTGTPTPCKDCEERSSNCHSDCERYAEFKVFAEKNRIMELEERKKSSFYAPWTDAKGKNIWRKQRQNQHRSNRGRGRR